MHEGEAFDFDGGGSGGVGEGEFVVAGVVEVVRGVGDDPAVGAFDELVGFPAIGEVGGGAFAVHADVAACADAPEGFWVEVGDFLLDAEAFVFFPGPAFVDVVFGDHDALDVFGGEDAVAWVGEFLVDAGAGFLVVGIGEGFGAVLGVEGFVPAGFGPWDAAFGVAGEAEPADGAGLVLWVELADEVVDGFVAVGVAGPVGEAEGGEGLAEEFGFFDALGFFGFGEEFVAGDAGFAEFGDGLGEGLWGEVAARGVDGGDGAAFGIEEGDSGAEVGVPPGEGGVA